MKLSDAIREYVEMKIEGEPKSSEWQSIDAQAAERRAYHARLADLEIAIDTAAAQPSSGVEP